MSNVGACEWVFVISLAGGQGLQYLLGVQPWGWHCGSLRRMRYARLRKKSENEGLSLFAFPRHSQTNLIIFLHTQIIKPLSRSTRLNKQTWKIEMEPTHAVRWPHASKPLTFAQSSTVTWVVSLVWGADRVDRPNMTKHIAKRSATVH